MIKRLFPSYFYTNVGYKTIKPNIIFSDDWFWCYPVFKKQLYNEITKLINIRGFLYRELNDILTEFEDNYINSNMN